MSELLHFTGFPMPSDTYSFNEAFNTLAERPVPNSGNNEMITQLGDAPSYEDIDNLRQTLDSSPEYALERIQDVWYLVKGNRASVVNFEARYLPDSIYLHTHPSNYPPDPSFTDIVTAIGRPPSIIWGIISEAGLTIYKPKDPYELVPHLEDHNKLRKGLYADMNWLAYNDPECRVKWQEDPSAPFRRAEKKIARVQQRLIPWGDEARLFWEALTVTYSQGELFNLEDT